MFSLLCETVHLHLHSQGRSIIEAGAILWPFAMVGF